MIHRGMTDVSRHALLVTVFGQPQQTGDRVVLPVRRAYRLIRTVAPNGARERPILSRLTSLTTVEIEDGAVRIRAAERPGSLLLRLVLLGVWTLYWVARRSKARANRL